MQRDCQWKRIGDRLHCPNCNQPDFPPLDRIVERSRWILPVDPAEWPKRTCRAVRAPILRETTRDYLAACRACEYYRAIREPFMHQEHCLLDTELKTDGTLKVCRAVGRFAPRALGVTTPCPRQVPGNPRKEPVVAIETAILDSPAMAARRGFTTSLEAHPRLKSPGPDPAPQYPPITRRNLTYHVYASRQNGLWRENCEELRRRLPVFNGRKLVVVSEDARSESFETIREALGDSEIEYLRLPNDPRLRETAGFKVLLPAVRSVRGNEATFFAHTKGNTTHDDPLGARVWRDQMYHHLLDWIKWVDDLLTRYAAVGTTIMQWPEGIRSPFPTAIDNRGHWMFAGCFFWFRHDCVFSRPQWSYVPDDRYGAESWIGGVLDMSEVRSLYQPWPEDVYPTPDPYDPETWRDWPYHQ